ncbi:MAG: hypothetical protein AB4426_08235 [Xenococcaceae cyanobacterium]
MVSLRYPEYDTPSPGEMWTKLSETERVSLITESLSKVTENEKWIDFVSILSGKPDGQVIISLVKPLPANQRGSFLLDMENYLKKEVDPALTIWLEPIGDRNSLRNLRGIEVKS